MSPYYSGTSTPYGRSDSGPSDPSERTVNGKIESLKRYDSGWVIGTLAGRKITGEVPSSIQIGDTVEAEGKWEKHSRYGWSFRVFKMSSERPTQDLKGIERYLSRALPWIQERQAANIVKAFGTKTYEVIEKTPGRLTEIAGITEARAEEIADAWAAGETHRQADQFFAGLNIRPSMVNKLYKRFSPSDALAVVKEDPYCLSRLLDGVGFKLCDEIASNMGIADDDPRRKRAVLLHVIEEATGEGHCYLKLYDTAVDFWKNPLGLLARARDLYHVRCAESDLDALLDEGVLVREDDRIYPKKLYLAEQTVADSLGKIMSSRTDLDFDSAVLETEAFKALNEAQRAAVQHALDNQVLVLTGGPGTGKTWTVQFLLEALGIEVEMAAPTGRAAKRMEELSGTKASTIHRLLEYGPLPDGTLGFRRGEVGPPLVVVDEASMLDVRLAADLLSRIKAGTRMIIIGDVDQLPSVGPGNVLHDLLESGAIPSTRLHEVMRQETDSPIVHVAHHVRKGHVNIVDHFTDDGWHGGQDFQFISEGTPEGIQGEICQTVLGMAGKYNLMEDVQVLCPQKKTAIGTIAMNSALQEAINPRVGRGEPFIGFGKIDKATGIQATRYFVDDRVINIKNIYEPKIEDGNGDPVFNGDVGRVESVNSKKKSLTVRMGDGRLVKYESEDLVNLQLAYAITIHKCVHPDTRVETPEGWVRIADIPEEGTIGTKDGPAAYRGKVTNPEGRAIRVETRSGYQVVVTPEHGMDAWGGENYERREAGQLVLGDILRLKVGHVVRPQRVPSLPDIVQGDVREKIWPTPPVCDSDVALFLGLMVADGTRYRGGFRLAKRHRDVVGTFEGLCAQLFGVSPTVDEKLGAYHAEVSSTYLSRWLAEVGGMDPKAKAVPEVIWRSMPEAQAAFLRGVFEDGTVNLRDEGIVDHIEWYTSSVDLGLDVQRLLLRCGVASRRVRADREGFLLAIYGRWVTAFRKKVGFVSHWKRARLENPHGSGSRSYRLPLSDTEARAFRDEFRGLIHRSTLNNVVRTGWATYATLKEAFASPAPAESSVGALAERYEYLHEDIVALEEITAPSVCVEVPEGHQFLQGGFCGWNSQGSEYKAVVIPLHKCNRIMLRRKLLYTGITRAATTCVLVGQKDACRMAIADGRVDDRNTSLIGQIEQREVGRAPLETEDDDGTDDGSSREGEGGSDSASSDGGRDEPATRSA